MSNDFTRRELLKSWGLLVGAGVVAPQLVFAEVSKPGPSSKTDSLIRLSLNENPYGSSPNVVQDLQLELGRLNRYADAPLARQLAEQIAEYEHVPVEQVVLGEIRLCSEKSLTYWAYFSAAQVVRAASSSTPLLVI
jgi:hypothetical protein